MKAMKTVEEMRSSVLAECARLCPNRDFPAKADWGHLMFGYVKYDGDDYEAWFLYVSASIHPISLYARSADQIWIAAYRILGLSDRDAVEDEREIAEEYLSRLKAERAKNAALVAAAELVIKRNWERINGDNSDYSLFSQAIGNLGDAIAANEKGGKGE